MLKSLWVPSYFTHVGNASFAGFYLEAGIGPGYAQFKQKSHVFDTLVVNVVDTKSFSGTGFLSSHTPRNEVCCSKNRCSTRRVYEDYIRDLLA